MTYLVKLCGTTTIDDAQMAVDYGAHYSGLVVEVSFSERSITVDQAKQLRQQTLIPTVVLFFNQTTDWVLSAVDRISPFAVQLLGHESPAQVNELKKNSEVEIWKSLFMPVNKPANAAELTEQVMSYVDAGADSILLDTVDLSQNRFGGTGKTADWEVAAEITKSCLLPVFLSGGLNQQNIAEAIRVVQPSGIDLCSGVEISKGKRDRKKVRGLMTEVEQVARKL